MRYDPEQYKCKKHPKYAAIRKPRAECAQCWKHYYHRQEAYSE